MALSSKMLDDDGSSMDDGSSRTEDDGSGFDFLGVGTVTGALHLGHLVVRPAALDLAFSVLPHAHLKTIKSLSLRAVLDSLISRPSPQDGQGTTRPRYFGGAEILEPHAQRTRMAISKSSSELRIENVARSTLFRLRIRFVQDKQTVQRRTVAPGRLETNPICISSSIPFADST